VSRLTAGVTEDRGLAGAWERRRDGLARARTSQGQEGESFWWVINKILTKLIATFRNVLQRPMNRARKGLPISTRPSCGAPSSGPGEQLCVLGGNAAAVQRKLPFLGEAAAEQWRTLLAALTEASSLRAK